MKSIYQYIWIAISMLSTTIYVQSQIKEVKLSDIESLSPIPSATMKYGDQISESDDMGILRFYYQDGKTMELYHANYGTWTLTENEIKKAIAEKIYHKSTISYSLSPITVIGIKRNQTQPNDEINIEYQNRLKHDAADILKQDPGFSNIVKGGNYGFDPVFRGFKYDQLNIVINGAQSASAACPNRMDPPTSQMSPNMIDRIEILKGPHALRFGTGLGATINFIPGKLQFTNINSIYGRASMGYESNGNLIRGETQLGLSSNKIDASIFGSWSQGDDYTTGNDKTVQSDFNRGSFGTNIGVKLSTKQQLLLSAVYNRARDADFPALPMDLRKDNTWLFSLRHDIHIDKLKLKNWNTTFFGSFVSHLMDNKLKPLTPRMVNATTPANTENYGVRTEGFWKFAKTKIYVGADFRKENANGVRTREMLLGPMAGRIFKDTVWQNSSINKLGLFLEYQIDGKIWDYILSTRVELNTAKVNAPAKKFKDVYSEAEITQFNPSFSFGILRDFGHKLKWGLWVSRAQRSGSLSERFINYLSIGQDPYEMLGNPQLSPEINYQADMTFKIRLNNTSTINLDFYTSYLHNYISSLIDPTLRPIMPSSPGVRRFVNIDKAIKTGFEMSIYQQLFTGLEHRIGLSYTYGKNLKNDKPLPEIAPFDLRYSLLGRYFNNKLQPEISLRIVREQSRISNEFGETKSPGFTLIDIKLGYQLSHSVLLNIGINNLLDKAYYEHLSRYIGEKNNPILSPGRNLYFNVNYTIQ